MAGIRLLIVDDDPETAAFIRLKLSREAPHFSIDTSESGRDCLEYLKSNSVDCILSDYQMPGMNGVELLEALRAGGDNTPFIFITGQGNEAVAREAFMKGANDYFTKEIGFAHFTRVVNSIEQAVRHRITDTERARAEEALVEEKNKLEAMFASIPDGISMLSPDFRVIYQNARQEAIVGNHVGELCYRAYHGRDDVCEGCMVAAAFKDGATRTAQREIVRDGKKVYLENTATPVRDASGKVIACMEIVKNITDRRMAEDKARERGRLLDSVLDSIEDGILVLDRDLNIIKANPAVGLLSRSPGVVAGHRCYEAVMGSDEPCADCPAVLTLKTGGAFRKEREMGGAGGASRWIELRSFPLRDEDTGGLTGAIEYLRDITERKKAGDELLAAKKSLEILLTHNPAVIYRGKLDEKFSATYVSDNVRENYGYEPEEFTSDPDFWLLHIHPEDVKRVLDGAVILMKEGQHAEEYRFMHKDGGYRWVRDYVNLVKDAEGRPSHVVGCMLDIDEVKRHGLRKEEFYSMVSHDLKSPIVAIQGYAELISDGSLAGDELRDAAIAIQSSSMKLVQLINDFLDITRIEAGRLTLYLEHYDLNRIVTRLAGAFTVIAAGKRQKLVVEAADEPVVCELDEMHITRAVSNLLQNAVNYTPEGGSIVIRTRMSDVEGARYAVVEVSDNGPGIPASEQSRVFDMYYRSGGRTSVMGSGLGLASVKAIVVAHGGRVELQSEEGKGATFSILLPAAHDRADGLT